MDELVFNAERHEYRLNGRQLPSVTQVLSVLEDWSKINPELLAAAAEFGTHVHQAVDLWNKRRLDEAALDPALRPYLDGWRKFLADSGAKVVDSELRVAHHTLGYAGTIDTVCRLRGVRTLVDVKTGTVPRTVGPQLAAYAKAYGCQTATASSSRRLCVQLTGDGYKAHECNDPADWSVFLSALNCWRFRNVA